MNTGESMQLNKARFFRPSCGSNSRENDISIRQANLADVKSVMQRGRRENLDVSQFMQGPVQNGLDRIARINNKIDDIGDKFKEFNHLRGKILARMYRETAENEKLYEQEKTNIIQEFKELPATSLYSQKAQSKARMKEQLKFNQQRLQEQNKGAARKLALKAPLPKYKQFSLTHFV